MKEKLHFRNWTIEHDPAVTRDIYAAIPTGFTERCGCNDCLRFIQMRETFFHPELLNLLDKLGIDHRKEAEVFTFSGDRTPWNGWFHFVGHIESGEQNVEYLDGNFQIILFNQAAAPQSQFKGHETARLEFQSPTDDLRHS